MTNVALSKGISLNRKDLAHLFAEYAVWIVLGIVLLVNLLITPNFAQVNTLWNLISQAAGLIIVSVGMTIVVSSGGIDLSAGSMMAIAAISFTHMAYATNNVGISLLFSFVVCGIIGIFNGYMISKWKVQPIILTLCMQMILRGASLLSTSGNALLLDRFPSAEVLGLYRFPNGMPGQVIPIVIVLGIALFLLKMTRFGKNIEYVGDNSRGARLTGISITGTLLAVYMSSALLSCLGGLTEMFRTGACDPTTMGLTYETNAIAAVAIGGTSMKGGRAKIFGSFLGAIIMTLINSTVNMNNVPFAYSNVVKTIIIIVAVSLQSERKA
ncbi:ABC transporter permease [Oscillospiraceae bacterium MB08-C2-2]|nr:ABC transporter permease [Oscillospiraceae bacterium MB08-C2-2]